MFKRLRLWFWKWFRPSKYSYYIGQHAVAGFLAGFTQAGAASKEAAGELAKITQAMAAFSATEAEKEAGA